MKDVSPQPAARPPHPLALALIERLRTRSGARILEIGPGSGRNTTALSGAGFIVESFNDAFEAGYAGALSTHALLHGTPKTIAAQLAKTAALLEPGAPVHATFGSVRDARYGKGERVEEHVYSPVDGDEAHVPHAFFDRDRLLALLEPRFTIESLDEVDVDRIAGKWAHERTPLRDAVHWFALLHTRSSAGGVREARPGDLPSWLDMRCLLWPEADPAELRDEIKDHFALEPRQQHVFVYEDSAGELAGMLELSLRSTADCCLHSPVPFIEAWFVREQQRHRGVGRSLVRQAEYWARSQGFTEIASDTQLENDGSILAHKALGFDEVERAVHFRKVL